MTPLDPRRRSVADRVTERVDTTPETTPRLPSSRLEYPPSSNRDPSPRSFPVTIDVLSPGKKKNLLTRVKTCHYPPVSVERTELRSRDLCTPDETSPAGTPPEVYRRSRGASRCGCKGVVGVRSRLPWETRPRPHYEHRRNGPPTSYYSQNPTTERTEVFDPSDSSLSV